MPIGRFARSCRLSIKALRYYDEEGLLKPALVSGATGYRYYSQTQAREAVLIGMLRSLGIGVAAIREILFSGGDRRQELLQREIGRIEQEVRTRQQALRAVQRLAQEGSLTPYEVGLRVEPPVTVGRRSMTTSAERIIPDTTALIYGLLDALREAGCPELDPVLCLTEEADRDERITVCACARVAAPLPKRASFEVVELPGGTFAWLTHHGAYEELGLAYHALVQERGHEPHGPMREVYLNDPAQVPPEQLVTVVLLPIAGA
ncbi:MAG: MerR family transcriptional regulator [Gemmatimonadaceae bacterium]